VKDGGHARIRWIMRVRSVRALRAAHRLQIVCEARGYELFEITGDAQRLERAKRFIVDGLAAGALKPAIEKALAK